MKSTVEAAVELSVPEEFTPPRDNLVRALYPGVEFRAADEEENGLGTMTGHFAVFNQWTEIDSIWEGRFMERILPGAFRKTFKENRAGMRVLFQHGRDPQIGDKPLGPIDELDEDDIGASYAVPLLDTSYNRDLLPGLKHELYGASFRFRVMKEEVVSKPKPSAHNPDGIPERSVAEAAVAEFGPVTFPAYAGATAGIRSLTDSYIFAPFLREPDKLGHLIEYLRSSGLALPSDGAEPPAHSDEGSRVIPPSAPAPRRFRNREEFIQWISST